MTPSPLSGDATLRLARMLRAQESDEDAAAILAAVAARIRAEVAIGFRGAVETLLAIAEARGHANRAGALRDALLVLDDDAQQGAVS